MPDQVQCGDFEDLAVLYATGEMEEPDRVSVEQHARACANCAAVLQREMEFAELLSARSQTPAEAELLLSQCRRDLSEALQQEAARPKGMQWLLPWNWAWASRTSLNFHPAWSVAILILIGLTAGVAGWEGIGRTPMKPSPVMTIAAAPALSERDLSSMGIESLHWESKAEASPNVELRLRTDRPIVLRGSPADNDIRRVLAYIVGNGSRFDSGVRLDSLELLRSQATDPAVTGAIRQAAERDPNPAVRLRALESLRQAGANPDVRHTMLQALAQDDNSGVRIEAVDGLLSTLATPDAAAGWRNDDAMQILQDRMHNDPNDYVRMRSATAFAQLASARGQLANGGR